MVTKLLHTPNSLPFTIFFLPKPSLPKSTIISLFSTTNHSLSLTQSLTYGPSLLKGIPLSQNHQNQHQQEEDYKIINEDQFTRIFHISALRVPSKDCFALENRLRGHLLNWPRIRNVARVPGDDIDADGISTEEINESSLDSLNRRINGKAEGDGERLSPVLYREKLIKSFNVRGFVRFKNLARISRPKQRKRKREGEGEREWEDERKESGRKEVVVVEVLEEEDEREEMKGLLGEGFKGGRKWKGSTRLLLLDERFKDKEVEELPQAIQVYHHCHSLFLL